MFFVALDVGVVAQPLVIFHVLVGDHMEQLLHLLLRKVAIRIGLQIGQGSNGRVAGLADRKPRGPARSQKRRTVRKPISTFYRRKSEDIRSQGFLEVRWRFLISLFQKPCPDIPRGEQALVHAMQPLGHGWRDISG